MTICIAPYFNVVGKFYCAADATVVVNGIYIGVCQ